MVKVEATRHGRLPRALGRQQALALQALQCSAVGGRRHLRRAAQHQHQRRLRPWLALGRPR